ncbi:CBS domain-containing protein [Georgenia sp. H159]|uniref:CBS domain-containing protein n=1 Tax=Georgenia sp. H159 TaxID=3076115 RepID=UPI002D7A3404|nr:CBS domain-containing protein [Georgenia sp. H159]
MTDTQHTRPPAERFIAAYESALDHLSHQYEESFHGFGAVLRHEKARRNQVVERNQAVLRRLAELRNVIAHNPSRDGEPIAIPRPHAVEQMERIAQLIQRQPPIKDFMVVNPIRLSRDSTLAEVAATVVELDISQMPIYEGDEYVGLFTTNAMARWLSASIAEDGILLAEDVTVAKLIEHAEEHEQAAFVKPTVPALRAAQRMLNPTAPPALLISTDGTEAGQLQGIFTRFEVAAVLKEVTVPLP